MTILIKGMEMPETCYYCPFSAEDYKGVVMPSCILVGEDMSTYEYRHSRHEQCPLIEVPTPHGRLIDINDVKNTKFAAENINQYERWWNGALDSVIENAPTVIEAEEG